MKMKGKCLSLKISQTMWVFRHSLVTIRNDSAVRRSLGPAKVELTQGSSGDPKVICPEPEGSSKHDHCLQTQASCQRDFRLPHLQSCALARKSQHHTGPDTGQPLWQKDVKGWLDIEKEVQRPPDCYILHVAVARQRSSVTYHMLSV